ncbi:hypothetical protein SPFM8_00018 [Salmonella phage SPFM8]|nr:hypothetical protein SPFM8_00018 [Salmonella phage SPFM8]
MEGKLRKEFAKSMMATDENPTQKEWAASISYGFGSPKDLTLDIGNAAFSTVFSRPVTGVAGGLIADRAKADSDIGALTLEDADALRQHDANFTELFGVKIYEDTLPVTKVGDVDYRFELDTPAATLSEDLALNADPLLRNIKMAEVTSMKALHKLIAHRYHYRRPRSSSFTRLITLTLRRAHSGTQGFRGAARY